MVLAAIAVGLFAAITVRPPTEVPAAALQAVVIYRFEVGMAVFFGLYLATMAFALAVQNRGFTEIGSGIYRPGGKGANMPPKRRLDTPEEVRARHERMDRLVERLRARMARKEARWRAEGIILPPEEPRRRV